MFDSPLVWCANAKGWVALEESDSLCRKMQACSVPVCPKSGLFAAVASAARQGEENACPAGCESAATQPGSDLRIF